MRVTRFFGERDLGELLDRLFSFKGEADAIRRAGQAMVEANTHLPLDSADNLADVVKPGAMLAVPPVPGAEPRGTAVPVADAAGETALERMRKAAPAFAARLAATNDRSREIVRDAQGRLNDPALRAATAGDERLRELVSTLEERSQQRLEALGALQHVRDDVLRHVEETVTALMELAARGAHE